MHSRIIVLVLVFEKPWEMNCTRNVMNCVNNMGLCIQGDNQPSSHPQSSGNGTNAKPNDDAKGGSTSIVKSPPKNNIPMQYSNNQTMAEDDFFAKGNEAVQSFLTHMGSAPSVQ